MREWQLIWMIVASHVSLARKWHSPAPEVVLGKVKIRDVGYVVCEPVWWMSQLKHRKKSVCCVSCLFIPLRWTVLPKPGVLKVFHYTSPLLVCACVCGNCALSCPRFGPSLSPIPLCCPSLPTPCILVRANTYIWFSVSRALSKTRRQTHILNARRPPHPQ